MKNKFLFFFGCLSCVLTYGQLDTYDYKMEVSGIKDQWHKIELLDSVFEEVSQSMNDLRIYGVTETDTIEAPYIMKVGSGKHLRKAIDFKRLNEVSNANGYYFTYEISTSEAIDQIQLDFENENFDWKVVLEGSQNQNEWFTLLDDYRILSIKNAQTDYSFTNLDFLNSKYRYYRLLIKSKGKPVIKSAKISIDSNIEGRSKDYIVGFMNIEEEGKSTILDIDFKKRLPISFLKINISDKVDYYRPFAIEYISDSVQTEKGWRYNYRNFSSGTLNSIEKNELVFPTTFAQKFRVTVQNRDNQPLQIESASAKGYVHELIARFTKPATYYLAYGKANARKPQYDISQAATKIPEDISVLTLGEVQSIPKKEVPTVAPLFENKLWLWVVMGGYGGYYFGIGRVYLEDDAEEIIFALCVFSTSIWYAYLALGTFKHLHTAFHQIYLQKNRFCKTFMVFCAIKL